MDALRWTKPGRSGSEDYRSKIVIDLFTSIKPLMSQMHSVEIRYAGSWDPKDAIPLAQLMAPRFLLHRFWIRVTEILLIDECFKGEPQLEP